MEIGDERDLEAEEVEKESAELLLGEDKTEIIKEAIKKYLFKKITKEGLREYIREKGVKRCEFNLFITDLVSVAHRSKKWKKAVIDYGAQKTKEYMRLNSNFLESFLLEIKKNFEESAHQQPVLQYSMYRRTPEDLSATISNKPQLVSLFSAGYNVLCSNIQKVLSVKDLQNRMKKASFEYRLSEQTSVEAAKCAHECLKQYLKETIGKVVDRRTNKIDVESLLRMTFGGVLGAYLLYEKYPNEK